MFSKLDLKQGYQQLTVDEETAKILTVNTHRGLFIVRRLAFGVKAAAGAFQRTMEDVIRGIDGVIAFQDDICISGSSREEHDHRLRNVLERLKEYGLTVRKKKCVLSVCHRRSSSWDTKLMPKESRRKKTKLQQ